MAIATGTVARWYMVPMSHMGTRWHCGIVVHGTIFTLFEVFGLF